MSKNKKTKIFDFRLILLDPITFVYSAFLLVRSSISVCWFWMTAALSYSCCGLLIISMTVAVTTAWCCTTWNINKSEAKAIIPNQIYSLPQNSRALLLCAYMFPTSLPKLFLPFYFFRKKMAKNKFKIPSPIMCFRVTVWPQNCVLFFLLVLGSLHTAV